LIPRIMAPYRAAACATLLAMLVVASIPARSEELSADQQKGLTILRAHCARCHAVGRTGASPFKPAPPFRTLHLRYPIESLEESLAEGIITGHPAMPEFRFDPEQVGDIITYLKSLER
jgi:cytochrome c